MPETIIPRADSDGMGAAQISSAAATSRLYPEVIKLALPAIAEQLLFTVVQMAALIIVGQLGPESIAAVGVGNQINWFFQSGYFALGAGTTTLVARSVGASQLDMVESTARQALVLATLIAIVISICGFMLTPAILVLMGTEGNVLAQASVYLRLLFISAVFGSINMCSSAALRGAGDTRTPFKVASAGAIINVGIMWLLVYGRFGLPSLGIAGAGLAIILSQLMVSLGYLAVFLSRKFAVRVGWSRFVFDVGLVKRLLTIGVPAALEQLFMSGGMTLFARLVISLGTLAYASHQVAVNVTSISYMTGFGLSMAATCLVGQSLGAGKPDLAEAYAVATRKIGFWIMASLSVAFFLLGPLLVDVYTNDAEIITSGAYILRWAAFAQPALGTYSILAGALRGAGDTKYPLYITFVGVWVVRLVVAYTLVSTFKMGLAGVWIAVIFDQWVRAALVLLRFRTGRWKAVKV